MGNVDRLDMSVFQIDDGIAWAKEMLDAEMLASGGKYDFSEYEVLSLVTINPDKLRTASVKKGGMELPMADAFMDVMSRAPESTMKKYKALRSLARRFGSGANDWIERREPVAISFTRRKDRAPETKIELQLPLPGSRSEKLFVFNIDESLAPSIFDFMLDMAAESADSKRVGDILFFNLETGFAATITPGISLLSPRADHANIQLNRVFGDDLHRVPHVALWHEAEESWVDAILPRDLAGYSIYTYLEPFVKVVNVQRDRVHVNFDAVKRQQGTQLFYEYSHGVTRRGVKSPDGTFFRAEVPVDPTFSHGDIFGNIAGIARAHGASTGLYIDGSMGTADLGGVRNIGHPIGFQPGVVDLVATGPQARVALMSAAASLAGCSAVVV